MSDEVEGSTPTVSQVLIRATPEEKDRWKAAAEKSGQSMSDFIRSCCNERSGELLDCQHPVEYRKTYPWSSTCMKCGVRLMG